MKNICVITGSRAEYGLLKGIMKEIENKSDLNLLLFVTGTHLEEKYGKTKNIIEQDGFKINEEIFMNLNGDTSSDILNSMGIEMMEMSKRFTKYDIDYVLILGDRYEMLVAAQIALINQIKLIHFCGGDVTEGAYDNSIRNAITKMSDYHLVTCESSYNNLLNMGEKKENIILVGNPGLYDILDFKPLEKHSFYEILKIKERKRLFLIVNHSETLISKEENKNNLDILINALLDVDNFEETNFVFIHSNADNHNEYIFKKIDSLCEKFNNIYGFKSVDRYLYLNLIYYCNYFIGNSSSGIYEVPLLKKITLNLGNRQLGRDSGNTVLNINYNKEEIKNILNQNIVISEISYPYTVRCPHEILNMIPI
tara:strand:+ start:9359 stop:10459 length:1101 start_codon:yes stop_codon:yes gene_type:complete